MAPKNGKSLTEEDHKMLAELTLQNDERIERLWDMILELRNAACDEGWKIKDCAGSKIAAREREKSGGILEIQRERLRKLLGLG